MREPPYDDDPWPTLIVLVFGLLFLFGLMLVMFSMRDMADFVPTSSTLPRL